MSAIYKDGAWYGKGGSGGGDTVSVELTQAEYDALTPAQQEDGTVYYITDAIPTSQICYVGSKFNRSDIYKSTEQVVGSYLGKPLYQKVFDLGSDVEISHSSWYTSTIDKDDIEKMIELRGLRSDGAYCGLVGAFTQTNKLMFLTSMDSVFGIRYIIIQYTKSIDSANSAIYASENDYSTDETIVGTWIDGKPIYQKTWTGLNKTDNSDVWIELVQLPENCSSIISIENVRTNNSMLTGLFEVGIKSNGYLEFKQMSGGTRVIDSVTIQYTKTTD